MMRLSFGVPSEEDSLRLFAYKGYTICPRTFRRIIDGTVRDCSVADLH